MLVLLFIVVVLSQLLPSAFGQAPKQAASEPVAKQSAQLFVPARLTTEVNGRTPMQEGRAKPAALSGDWPSYNHDLAGTRYSPLTQINAANVSKLSMSWTYTTRGAGGGAIGGQVTPIVVNRLMYVSARNLVVALEPETGKEVWRYQLTEGQASPRGVAFWQGDHQNPPRIIFTAGRNLVALNANTGKLDPGFGKEGMVDMVIGYTGVPTIFNNVITVGASVAEDELGPSGNTRAYDARTGSKLWEFNTVAQPGDPGHDTWLTDGWKHRSGTNVWAWNMSGDAQRGLLYMPIDGPASNYYGGDRPGANLYGNSIVAVDAQTGKYKWHFQTVHHDLWDFDNPPAPALLDITQNGHTVPVLAQIGKTGLMYIVNRETGKPIFGVEERPVAKGDVPGEWYSPTQPFPLKPPALAKMDFKPSDVVTAEDTTPEHAKNCQALVARSGGFYNAGPFTPFLYHEDGAPPKSTIIFPGSTGGTNWGGMATDQRLGYVFAYTQDLGQVGWMEKRKVVATESMWVMHARGLQRRVLRLLHIDEQGGIFGADSIPSSGADSYEQGSKLEYGRASVDGTGPFFTFSADAGNGLGVLPCQKPPWGTLNAVNANTGEIVWRVPLGITEGLPAGKQHTGRAGGLAGPTATAGGLVFIGAVSDNRFRAFASKTGKELWVTKLSGRATADPITYMGKNGKQYVAVVAAGSVNVFALP
jgi:glucose dehydrogenase